MYVCRARLPGGGQALVMHAKVAILLTSLLFVFKNSFLPKFRVNYYDYIIKWCFGIFNVIGVYRWVLPTF